MMILALAAEMKLIVRAVNVTFPSVSKSIQDVIRSYE